MTTGFGVENVCSEVEGYGMMVLVYKTVVFIMGELGFIMGEIGFRREVLLCT